MGGIFILKINKRLLIVAMVFISLLAVGAVSAADDIVDDAVIAEADDSVDALAVEEDVEEISAVDVQEENVAEAEVGAADSEVLSVADEPEKLSFGSSGNGTKFNFGSGNGTKFNFSNMTFNINGTTFNLGDLGNGTFSLGNGTTFNISSLLNGTFSFGNGTSFNISSFLNGTGNGTTFDLSSFMNIFGGSQLTATTADIEKVYSGNTIFKATILDSNKTVGNGNNVIFTINNKDYIARTDANGTASVSLNLKAGTYYIYTEYNNDILAKNEITIKKAASKITAKAKAFKAKTKTKKYTIILKNNKGKVIKNAKVTLKIKGKKIITATTNKYGKATFKITKLTKKGKYTSTVKFAGNGYYKASTKSVKITVK